MIQKYEEATRQRTVVNVAVGDQGVGVRGSLAPKLFESSQRFAVALLRLFELEALGETGWLKALSLNGYASRRLGRPQSLQEALFPPLTRASG